MDFTEYTRRALEFRRFHEDATLWYASLGLRNEYTEYVNVSLEWGSLDLERRKREMGDVLWNIALLGYGLRLSLAWPTKRVAYRDSELHTKLTKVEAHIMRMVRHDDRSTADEIVRRHDFFLIKTGRQVAVGELLTEIMEMLSWEAWRWLDSTLPLIAEENIEKLSVRQREGKILAPGDKR